jgi:hypothetical protein
MPEVRQQLDAICASEFFSQSNQLRKILTFVVEHDLMRKKEKLTAKLIRDCVLDGVHLEDDTDPTAAVRVQVVRLRRLLDTYYMNEGERAPLRICIAHRTYRPEYHWRKQELPEAGERDTLEQQRNLPDVASKLTFYQRLCIGLATVAVLKLLIIIALLV